MRANSSIDLDGGGEGAGAGVEVEIEEIEDDEDDRIYALRWRGYTRHVPNVTFA